MATKAKKWSQHVTETSDAMDVEPGTFKLRSAKKIAEAVEHDAEKSTRKKESSYRAAMSMLTFYINRAGKNLPASQRKVLENAKEVLRSEFGPAAKPTPKPKPKPKPTLKPKPKPKAKAKKR